MFEPILSEYAPGLRLVGIGVVVPANRGLPGPYPGINGISTSLTEARSTLNLVAKLGFVTPVLHAADLLVFSIVLRDRDAITDLVITVLGSLTWACGGA